MNGLIQFVIGRNGELGLLIARELWEDMRAAAEAGQMIEEESGLLRVPLQRLSESRVAAFSLAPADAPPCPPIVRITLS